MNESKKSNKQPDEGESGHVAAAPESMRISYCTYIQQCWRKTHLLSAPDFRLGSEPDAERCAHLEALLGLLAEVVVQIPAVSFHFIFQSMVSASKIPDFTS